MHGYTHDFDLYRAWTELVIHGRFDVPTAIRLGQSLDEAGGIHWYEEPVPPESYHALKQVRERVRVLGTDDDGEAGPIEIFRQQTHQALPLLEQLQERPQRGERHSWMLGGVHQGGRPFHENRMRVAAALE